LPLWLLQNEHLDPSGDLASSRIPRLFLDRTGFDPHARLFEASAYPKQYFDLRALPDTGPDSAFTATLTRFYDDVLH